VAARRIDGDVLIDPAQFHSIPAYDLLVAASEGQIGIDQRLIHALVDNPEKTLPDILRFASAHYRQAPIDLEEDLISILRHLRSPEALPYFLESVRRHLEDVPNELAEAIVAIGAPALEPLLSMYHEVGEEQGGEIAFILAELQIRDPRILELLLERLEYDAHDGALLLEIYGDPAAIPAIEAMAAGISDDEELRNDLLDHIHTIRETQREPYTWDFDIWDRYPETATPEFSLLREEDRFNLLSSDSAELRAAAAQSFFEADLSAEVLARLLDMARHDPDATVRGNAWAALADQTTEPEIQRSLTEALTDPNRPLAERAGAALALSRESERPEVFRAIEELYQKGDSRRRALEAMWRSLDRRFGKYAAQSLDDPDFRIQREAVRGIGLLGVHSEAARLRPLFEDPDLREDALHAFAMSTPCDVTRPRVRALYPKIEELAGGLTDEEHEVVKDALDFRLEMHGLKPVFGTDPEADEPEPVVSKKVGRNDPCPCGSGKKYKKCCGAA
jgi:SEC-C motif